MDRRYHWCDAECARPLHCCVEALVLVERFHEAVQARAAALRCVAPRLRWVDVARQLGRVHGLAQRIRDVVHPLHSGQRRRRRLHCADQLIAPAQCTRAHTAEAGHGSSGSNSNRQRRTASTGGQWGEAEALYAPHVASATWLRSHRLFCGQRAAAVSAQRCCAVCADGPRHCGLRERIERRWGAQAGHPEKTGARLLGVGRQSAERPVMRRGVAGAPRADGVTECR